MYESPYFSVGDVLVLRDERTVRVVAVATFDNRKRIGVRNVDTNRLSYIPEWRLLRDARVRKPA